MGCGWVKLTSSTNPDPDPNPDPEPDPDPDPNPNPNPNQEGLKTPALLVGNLGYAIATPLALLFYSCLM